MVRRSSEPRGRTRATEWAPPATSPRTRGKALGVPSAWEGLQRSVQAEGDQVRRGAGGLLKQCVGAVLGIVVATEHDGSASGRAGGLREQWVDVGFSFVL